MRRSCTKEFTSKVKHDLARSPAVLARGSPASGRRRSRCRTTRRRSSSAIRRRILVPIDGAPVMKPVPTDSRFKRVINTRALILQGGLRRQAISFTSSTAGCMSSSLTGPWEQPFLPPGGIGQHRAEPLEGGRRRPPRRRTQGQSEAVARERRAGDLHEPGADGAHRLQGPAGFRPDRRHAAPVGVEHVERRADQHGEQQLLRAARPAAGSRRARFPGRGRSSRATRCRPDFARIPPHSLAGAVLPTVAGTPQAQEAVIENSIPQTATVPLKNGPKFTPQFDGPPQFVARRRHAAHLRDELARRR